MVLMFTDIEGSVALKTRVGGAAYTSMLARHDELFKKIIASCQGARIFQDTGDGFLARFATGSDAVNAALRFQVGLSKIAWEHEPLRVRIGLNLGEVQQIAVGQKADDQSKVVGLPMDIAARLMSLASGGQILLTRTIFDDARQYVRELPRLNGEAPADGETQPLRWMAHGQYLFKGANEPMDVFEVGSEGLSPLRAPTDSEKARRSVALSDEETLGWRPAAGLEVPRRAGWSLVEKLGEGGFGEVWLGKHARTKESRVFKFCFDSDRLRSFKRELTLFRVLRDVLGTRSDISRLFEVQLEASPYFLETEFSEKGDLAEYAGGLGGVANIPFEERLDIVARTADAVAAAHSVSVLHKDIKPSNILMYQAETGHVRPRLSDFGIGVLTDRSKLKGKNITVTGLTEEMLGGNQSSRTGTRMYAPPEMLRDGGEFTMQGDVYALGVLLYQLAAGDLSKPLAPGWESDIPDPLLRQDIADCVAGDLSKRLDSAKALADRIRALPQRRALARRSKLMKFGAAASIGLLVVAGLAAAWAVQQKGLREQAEEAKQAALAAKQEAETQRARAESMVAREILHTTELLQKFNERIEPLEGSTAARRWIADGAEKWLDNLDAEAQLDPAVRLNVARGFIDMGELRAGVRGGGGDANGLQRALVLYDRAIATAKKAADAGAPQPAAISVQSLAMINIAALLRQEGKPTDALARIEEARRLIGLARAAEPENFEYQRLESNALLQLGPIHRALENAAQSAAAYEQSLAIRQRFYDRYKDDPEKSRIVTRDLAVGKGRWADALKTENGIAVAMPIYQESLALRRELLRTSPKGDEEEARSVRDISAQLTTLSKALKDGMQYEQALPLAQESRQIVARLRELDPTNTRLDRDAAQAAEITGIVLLKLNRAKEAEDALRDQVRLGERLVRLDPSTKHQKIHTVGCWWLADALVAQNRREEAKGVLNIALAMYETMLAAGGDNAGTKESIAELRKKLEGVQSPEPR
jgi:class 3 adenylate cyclase/serine/threonine protein kinase